MRAGILAVLLFPVALHAATVVPNVRTLPDFTVVASTWPPYQFPPKCSPGETAIVFRLTIHNIGQAASAAINDYHGVWVQDNANPSWGGGSLLPAIPSWGTASVTVGLVGLKSQAAMTGHHQFTAIVNGNHSVAEANYNNDTLLIDVNFPDGFCGPVIATTTASGATVTPHNTTPPPGNQVPPQLVLGGSGLPAPTNLNNTITQGVCTKYGGPAAALACSAALPAGKLVLVWDYPFQNPVDGYRVYVRSGGAVRNVGGAKPVVTQTAPGVRLAILDPPPVGTCFAVTAFHGATESQQSATTFCVTAGNLAKTATFNANPAMVMIKDVFISKDLSDAERNGQAGIVRYGSDGLTVGSSHDTPEEENHVLRGYARFDTSSLAGHQITKAQLQLRSASTDGGPGLCLSQYGAASQWTPGQVLDINGPVLKGIVVVQGSDVDLDVTPIVQSAANAQSANTAFAITDGTSLATSTMLQIAKTCLTSYKNVTLKVVYY